MEIYYNNRTYNQIQYDVFILKKYLTRRYGQEKAIAAIKKNSSNLNQIAKALGKVDFEFFCLYFLQDVFVPCENNMARELSQSHYDLWQDVENMFVDDKFDKLEVIAPRGWAKTTVLDFALSIWLHCYRLSIYTLVCGRTENDSAEFITQTKLTFIENKKIIEAFGVLVVINREYTVNRLELELVNGTKIQAISSTSSMRGKKYNGVRPTCIIADDYQGKGDILTQEARDKKYKTWEEDSKYAGDKAVYRNGKKIKQATKFIVLGTILHNDCFMSRLLKSNEYHHVVNRVCDFNVDDYFNKGLWGKYRDIYFNHKLDDPVAEADEFYYQHEAEMQFDTIWPDKFRCLETAKDYFNNPLAFKQECQNDASSIGQQWFQNMRTEKREDIEKNIFEKTMLLVDPASGGKAENDFTAFLVGSLGWNKGKYARKGTLEKFNARKEFEKYINRIIEYLIEYQDITHVYIEKNTFNGADANRLENEIKLRWELRHRSITIINERAYKNKDDRIFTIVEAVNKGKIIFAEEDAEFTKQIENFRGQDFSEHDDAPDITATFADQIEKIEVITKIEIYDKNKFLERG